MAQVSTAFGLERDTSWDWGAISEELARVARHPAQITDIKVDPRTEGLVLIDSEGRLTRLSRSGELGKLENAGSIDWLVVGINGEVFPAPFMRTDPRENVEIDKKGRFWVAWEGIRRCGADGLLLEGERTYHEPAGQYGQRALAFSPDKTALFIGGWSLFYYVSPDICRFDGKWRLNGEVYSYTGPDSICSLAAVADDGSVFVADNRNNRAQIFKHKVEGRGQWTTERAELDYPTLIKIALHGNMLYTLYISRGEAEREDPLRREVKRYFIKD